MFDVITVGTATRDVFLQSHLFRPVADPHFVGNKEFPTGQAECFAFGGKIEISVPTFTVGGGAVNAAMTFARQGLSTVASFAVGKDYEGKEIMKALKQENIKAVASTVKDLPTAYSTILLSDRGERTILVYRGASEMMGRVRSDMLEARFAYVVPGAYPFAKISALFRKLSASRTRIAMNPSGHYIAMGAKKLKPLLDQLAVVIVNREEAASLTGLSYDTPEAIFAAMQRLTPGIVVMTDGPRGVAVADGICTYRAGIFPEQKLVDRTGAGDAFGSGFVAGIVRRMSDVRGRMTDEAENHSSDIRHPTSDDIQYAIRLGSANATSVVEAIGATPGILTREQFQHDARWASLDVAVTK